MFSISSSSCCWDRLAVPYIVVSIISRAFEGFESYLEGKVLEEVCGAVGLLGLCP